MRNLFLTIFSFFTITQTAAFAVDNEVSIAKQRLNRQIELIATIEPYVERPYLARLYVLRGTSKAVLDSIDNNGIAHKTTFQENHRLIVAYRFSVAFFKEIETQVTRDAIVEILKINDEIGEAVGFDDSPYTQITLNVYLQMEKLMRQLEQRAISQELKTKLTNTLPILGEVVGKAKATKYDARTVYPVAEKAFTAVQDLYPDFNKIAASDSAFEITLEIQGLNEFYAEFAKFNEDEQTE